MSRITLFSLTLLLLAAPARADVTLVQDGKPLCVIVVDPEVLKADAKLDPKATFPEIKAERDRQRLRESVSDLLIYLQKMSGGRPIVRDVAVQEKGIIPIYIGAKGEKTFGSPKEKDAAGQGWRLVVSDKKGVGCLGETDLAVSYAIYEILHRLGCRWYMPSNLGEHIPHKATITLPECDDSRVPATLYRGIGCPDETFLRRTRQGGMLLNAGSALQSYVTKEDLEKNPEWKAVINGKPHDTLFKWTLPGVRAHVAQRVLDRLEKIATPTISLSPIDDADLDESDDAKLDATDMDPTFSKTSKTDRLLALCNDVAETVTKKHPGVLLGFRAYADYTRPPVREKLHPNLVPQIAPITYNRHHPMTWEEHPNKFTLKELVEEWAKKARSVSHYWYGYNLAEVSAPNPLITRWSADVPLCLANNCKFWQPETISNFESSFLGLQIGMRLSFDSSQKPEEIVAETLTNFYGAAAEPMTQYWRGIDKAWIETREYAGCGFGYAKMFPPKVLAAASKQLQEAQSACKTDLEKERVRMAADSFAQFELFMKLRRDLAEGKLDTLKADADQWRETSLKLRKQYEAQFAFNSNMENFALRYFNEFFGQAYDIGSKVNEKYAMHGTPLREWKHAPDTKDRGEKAGAYKTDYDEAKWEKSDVSVQTWSSLGLHNYFGKFWYRRTVDVQDIPEGKKVLLWFPATDGAIKLWVNGKHVQYRDSKGNTPDTFDGFCLPTAFDITSAVERKGTNHIAIQAHRHFFNEVGTGGLLAAPILLVER